MKNKALIVVIFLSVALLGILTYLNYFNKKIYFQKFDEYSKIEVFSEYEEEKIKVCYGNKLKCTPIDYNVKGKVNTQKIGVYTITYEAEKNGIVSIRKKKVEVVDKTAPELIVEGDFNNVCPNGKVNNVTYKSTDNYDGNLTDKIEYKLNGDRIIYKVTDSSGNSTTKEYDVTIKDEEKPTLILNDDSTLYIVLNSKYVEPGYVAIDNCDGNITEKVKVDGTVNTQKAGTYEIKYSVEDDFGNETIVKRTVKVFAKNNYTPGVVSNKTIYLTFDDGPGKYTARLLDILKKYDVKATFFVTGYDNRYNDLLTREYAEGHTVGLHSYSHNYGLIYTSTEAYMEDLLKIQEKVKGYTGYESKIIRFPGGSSNTISRRYRMGIMSTLASKVEELGFRYFDWTIMSGDAGNTKDPNKIYQNVTGSLKENGINVVLMHDIKEYTVNSVERIIEYGLANGYTFAPLTMESPVVHQRINN